MAEGTRVTCEDLATGQTDSRDIKDNYVVTTDGRCYVDGIQHYPGTGTTVLTIKMRPVSNGDT